jgi:polysaccharide chain length determinant protein (PEP-CTERM system associated)
VRAYTPDDVTHILLRYRWFILLPFAAGLLAAPFLSGFAPEKFRSETLIMVVPQRVPDAYVRATVTEGIEDRLPSISEQILSRSRLETIITEMDLYRDLRSRMVMEDVVQAMRANVQVTIAANRGNAPSFRVGFVSGDPVTARAVTERLASLYINQNVRDRENQANSTSEFLKSQLEEAKQRLVEHEKKLEEYRRQHAGELPTQLQGNLQGIQSANFQLQALHDNINRALERRLQIERQISEAETAQENEPAPLGPVTVTNGTTKQRLDAARARVAGLLERYTPSHPEVLSAQRQVQELEGRLATEGTVDGSPAPERSLSPAEAANRKRIADLKADLMVVQRQLDGSRAEEQRLKDQVASLQAKVDMLPSRESELVELTRDYSTLQAAYTSLLTKREDSVLAANLERRQIGEQFRVLDPPSMPERPYNERQRLAVTFSGAAAGLMLGFLFVVVRELFDSSFRSEDEVMATLSIPVLALIPVMASRRERENKTRRERWLDIAGVAVMTAAVLVVAYWRLRS